MSSQLEALNERQSVEERRVRTLIRRDPNFRDGGALLATLRLEQGDVAGAASAVSMPSATASSRAGSHRRTAAPLMPAESTLRASGTGAFSPSFR